MTYITSNAHSYRLSASGQRCRNGGGRGAVLSFAFQCDSNEATKQNACSVTCNCVYISVYLYHRIPKVSVVTLRL